jgi:adenylate cyclase
MSTDDAPTFIDLAHQANFRLGDLEVRPSTREVVIGDHREVLEPRVMQVLVALARRRGMVVSRNDLIDACWGGRAVGEDAINRCIAGVRRLSEAHGGFSVETVVRVGYRLGELETVRRAAIRADAAAPTGSIADLIGQGDDLGLSSSDQPSSPMAVMFTGVVGYGRIATNDEAGVLAMVRVLQEELARLVDTHNGRVIALRGDGALSAFADASDALDCALSFQRQVAQFGIGVAEDRTIRCRTGLHYGHAVEADGILVGDTVNVAARLEQIAESAAILVSDAIRGAARRRPPMDDLGFHQLQGHSTPVRVWRLAASEAATAGAPEGGVTEHASTLLGGGRPTVAVLPFDHPADDREQTYLAEGIAEDVIAALSRFKWLFVLSRHSSFNYRKSSADLAQIKADLGVSYIVHGRLMCIDGQLRLAVALTDCSAGDTIWSRRFDGAIANIFAIQDEITATIVGALEPALLRREEEGAAHPSPRSLKHWDLFIRGRWHFWQLTYGHVAKAQEILTQALALKPDDAPTLSLLATTHFTRLWSGWSQDPDAELVQGRRLAMRAVRLDGDDAFAHYTFGIALTLTGSLDRAMAEQKRALELNPNFAGAMAEMGRYHAFSGAYDEAIDCLDRAIQASPGDAHFFLWFRDKAIAAFTSSRFDEAVAFANEATARRPDIFFNHHLLAASWAACGSLDKAKASFAEAQRILPTYSMQTLKFGHPFARPEDLARYVDALRQCGWDG